MCTRNTNADVQTPTRFPHGEFPAKFFYDMYLGTSGDVGVSIALQRTGGSYRAAFD
jgi:hypothetical protein